MKKGETHNGTGLLGPTFLFDFMPIYKDVIREKLVISQLAVKPIIKIKKRKLWLIGFWNKFKKKEREKRFGGITSRVWSSTSVPRKLLLKDLLPQPEPVGIFPACGLEGRSESGNSSSAPIVHLWRQHHPVRVYVQNTKYPTQRAPGVLLLTKMSNRFLHFRGTLSSVFGC